MCQNSNSYNIIDEVRYKILSSLYDRYQTAISIIINDNSKTSLVSAKLNELDYILKEVERYPISWKFYNKQSNKFSQDFESLIIFCDNKYQIIN